MVSITYKEDAVTSSRLGAPPLDPLVRPPMTYTRSRQVTAVCVVLGFSMGGAGVQVRVTGQKHQTSSVASWNGSATWRRIARQQFPRQPPVTNILNPVERREDGEMFSSYIQKHVSRFVYRTIKSQSNIQSAECRGQRWG